MSGSLSIPTPGANEFSAPEEQQMRQARDAGQASLQSLAKAQAPMASNAGSGIGKAMSNLTSPSQSGGSPGGASPSSGGSAGGSSTGGSDGTGGDA
jgi:hypothetical protein